MTTAIDLAHTTLLKTGQLEKTREEYALVRLSAKNIGQILALEDIAFADLTEDEEAFLLRKDHAFFEDHFAHGGAMLGIVHNGHLIAQSAIVNPTAQHSKNGMVDMPELQGVPPEKITVQQNVIVDPAFRGNRLMAVMIEEWMADSMKAGRTEAISEVAVGNPYSWYPYLQKGLHIESIGVDPADGTHVYNMHGHLPSLTKAFNAAASNPKSCVTTDLKKQRKLFAKGYKATGFEPASGTLVFEKKAKNGLCR